MRRRSLGLAVLPFLVPPRASRAQGPVAREPVMVFAAASLADALRELARTWEARGNAAPRLSFAASSALARQIEQGAPADLFLSADEAWADYLGERGLLAGGTRSSPIGNVLVLVAPSGVRGAEVERREITRGTDVAALLGTGRLATGDPAHVPAGRYAREALTWLGQWERVGPRIARAGDVRSALLLVERGEAPLGIVYATDAAASAGVRVVGTFPEGSHTPVTYPFALTRRAEGDARARALLGFLRGAEAAGTWRRFGFSVREG